MGLGITRIELDLLIGIDCTLVFVAFILNKTRNRSCPTCATTAPKPVYDQFLVGCMCEPHVHFRNPTISASGLL